MPGLLSKIFSSTASSLVEAVGDAIDKNVTSDEERKALDLELAKANMQYEIDVKTLDLKRDEAFLGDVASARENQSRIQESVNASWLAKNIQPILAIVLVGLTFVLYALVLYGKIPPEKKDVVVYILGALTTIATQVVSYFFGSSKGSSDKNDMIRAMK